MTKSYPTNPTKEPLSKLPSDRFPAEPSPDEPLLVYRESPFGDRLYFFNQLLFDLLLGNCDNHLKNYSFIWDGGWGGCQLSPMYDLLCTTYYPNTYREMGVSFCRSRRIDDVTWEDVVATARAVGVPKKMVPTLFDELAEQIVAMVPKAEASIADQGFPAVHNIASFLKRDTSHRIAQITATRSTP